MKKQLTTLMSVLGLATATIAQDKMKDDQMQLREVMVLRDTEGLSYWKIAAVCEIPIGNVMSRLARARHWMQSFLAESMEPPVASVEHHG